MIPPVPLLVLIFIVVVAAIYACARCVSIKKSPAKPVLLIVCVARRFPALPPRCHFDRREKSRRFLASLEMTVESTLLEITVESTSIVVVLPHYA